MSPATKSPAPPPPREEPPKEPEKAPEATSQANDSGAKTWQQERFEQSYPNATRPPDEGDES